MFPRNSLLGIIATRAAADIVAFFATQRAMVACPPWACDMLKQGWVAAS